MSAQPKADWTLTIGTIRNTTKHLRIYFSSPRGNTVNSNSWHFIIYKIFIHWIKVFLSVATSHTESQSFSGMSILSEQLRHRLGLEVLGFNFGSTSNGILVHPTKAEGYCWGSCHLYGRHGLSSGILTTGYPSPSYQAVVGIWGVK